jgi:uncharacterized protein with HEPN domain
MLPEDRKEKHPGIPWRKIIAQQNFDAKSK